MSPVRVHFFWWHLTIDCRWLLCSCRYDTAELRKKKLEKKQKKGNLTLEEEEELRGAVELIADRERQLSLLRKKQRDVFSSMAEVILDPSYAP